MFLAFGGGIQVLDGGSVSVRSCGSLVITTTPVSSYIIVFMTY